MKKLNLKEAYVSRQAAVMLLLFFAVILIELAAMTFHLFHGDYPTHLYAVRLYRSMLEYIMLDISIAVIGTFLVDLALREKDDQL